MRGADGKLLARTREYLDPLVALLRGTTGANQDACERAAEELLVKHGVTLAAAERVLATVGNLQGTERVTLTLVPDEQAA